MPAGSAPVIALPSRSRCSSSSHCTSSSGSGSVSALPAKSRIERWETRADRGGDAALDQEIVAEPPYCILRIPSSATTACARAGCWTCRAASASARAAEGGGDEAHKLVVLQLAKPRARCRAPVKLSGSRRAHPVVVSSARGAPSCSPACRAVARSRVVAAVEGGEPPQPSDVARQRDDAVVCKPQEAELGELAHLRRGEPLNWLLWSHRYWSDPSLPSSDGSAPPKEFRGGPGSAACRAGQLFGDLAGQQVVVELELLERCRGRPSEAGIAPVSELPARDK